MFLLGRTKSQHHHQCLANHFEKMWDDWESKHQKQITQQTMTAELNNTAKLTHQFGCYCQHCIFYESQCLFAAH